MAVVLVDGLHVAENDIPYANLGFLLLDGVHPVNRCYSLDGMQSDRVARLDQGPHRIARGLIPDGAAVFEILPNQAVPIVPKPHLHRPFIVVAGTAMHERPIIVEWGRRFVRVLQHQVRRQPRRS